jgi:hypothetical protein
MEGGLIRSPCAAGSTVQSRDEDLISESVGVLLVSGSAAVIRSGRRGRKI